MTDISVKSLVLRVAEVNRTTPDACLGGKSPLGVKVGRGSHKNLLRMTDYSVKSFVFRVAKVYSDTSNAFSGGKAPLTPLGVGVGRGHK